jgi:Ca-activated chloride channel family protein
MKTFQLLLLMFAGALAGSIQAAPTVAPGADLTLRVTPERGLVYSAGPRETVVEIDIEAGRVESARRAPMNLALVLDRSGSMQGPKIEKARQAACVALDQLADDDLLQEAARREPQADAIRKLAGQVSEAVGCPRAMSFLRHRIACLR